MSKSDRHFYEFGRFCLDPTEQLLLRDGKPIQLAPKTFETLVFFVRNNGHLLTKDELMHELWADTFVEENNLEKIISVLRKTLGENERSQSYIETIRRRGYRFAANVREINADGRVIVQETKQAPRPDISWSQSLKSRKTLVFAVIATFLILLQVHFFG